MARVLILSSYVAASRVGGGAQALALARLGIEPILVPTALLGRHPGHGPPGGGPVDAETFAAMLGAIEAQGLFSQLDAVITGHFSAPEQVAIAADVLARVKAASPGARLIVDPIMGDDDKGLYVKEAVAVAVEALLAPVADLIAPNAWELARLSGRSVPDLGSAVAAARVLGKSVMVSSIRRRDRRRADRGRFRLDRHTPRRADGAERDRRPADGPLRRCAARWVLQPRCARSRCRRCRGCCGRGERVGRDRKSVG